MELRRIDAHSHINFNAYKDDGEEVVRRALEDGTGMLAVGSQIDTSRRAVEYADKHEGIWAVVGLHPTHLYDHYVDEQEIHYKSRNETFDMDLYRALATSSPKVVGIGECGLDYYRLPEGADHDAIKQKQHDTFRLHCDLAHELDLPVMIHCRDAHGEVAAILEEYRDKRRPLRGDVHCFTGTWAEAERYLALGFYISFTGIVTFPPKKADAEKGETLADVARRVPLEKLLIETDAPYLAPVPFRGKRNEPAYVKHVGAFIAHVKGLETSEVEARTLQNTKDLFRLEF